MSVQIHPLHRRRDLTDGCIEVINNEWSRSKALRLHSLEKSCSTLPYSLVMTEMASDPAGKETVIGYCRFVKVLGQKKSVLIETVVVRKERRGQGLGRKLMELAENHAQKSSYEAMYLCTHDKDKFYEHLGYEYCEPVNTLGAQMLESCASSMETNTYIPFSDGDNDLAKEKHIPETAAENDVSHAEYSLCNPPWQVAPPPVAPTSPPPPPPPPPPLPSPTSCGGRAVLWMTKKLVES